MSSPTAPDTCPIATGRVVLGELLGEGAFGSVRLATIRSNTHKTEVCAIKMMPLFSSSTRGDMRPAAGVAGAEEPRFDGDDSPTVATAGDADDDDDGDDEDGYTKVTSAMFVAEAALLERFDHMNILAAWSGKKDATVVPQPSQGAAPMSLGLCGENEEDEEDGRGGIRRSGDENGAPPPPPPPFVFEYVDRLHHGRMGCILTEYCNAGSLADHTGSNGLDVEDLADVMSQLCNALDYLHTHHSCAIVHSDLKQENILLSLPFILGAGGRGQHVAGTSGDGGGGGSGSDGGGGGGGGGEVSSSSSPRRLDRRRTTVKLADFGSALPVDRVTGIVTDKGLLPRGTVCFSPPERFCLASPEGNGRGLGSGSDGTSASGNGGSRESVLEAETDGMEVKTVNASQSSERSARVQGATTMPTAASVGYGVAADMWGLGCVLWEASTGECLPLGTGPALLGRVASRVGCTKEWGAVVAGLTASMAKAMDTKTVRTTGNTFLAASPKPETTRAAPATAATAGVASWSPTIVGGRSSALQAARVALPRLLALLWERDPTKRPSARIILASNNPNAHLLICKLGQQCQ